MKTFYIRTYGCQMNELDSEAIIGILTRRGLKQIDDETADIVIFNTCSIRDLAERKILGKLGIMSRKKKRGLIGICGCMVMTKREKLLKKFPFIDFIIGTNNVFDINDAIDEVLTKKNQVALISEEKQKKYDHKIIKRKSKVKGSVSISQGCNNFCSYCIVPYTRGREKSKDPLRVLEECKHLKDLGYREIMLLGQNVNSYGLDTPSWNVKFPDLLYEIDKLGIERVRFMTSHPKDISKDLMHAIADLPSICESLHLPVQSGSSVTLKKMNRSYTIEDYLGKVEELKRIVPNITIGTDIIVGYPGEAEEAFLKTKELLKKVRFYPSFIFAFSKRKKTPAYHLKDLPSALKKKRLDELLTLQKKITNEDLKTVFGQNLEVLVEGYNKDKTHLKGRCRNNRKVVFKGDEKLIASMQNVKVTSISGETLIGEL